MMKWLFAALLAVQAHFAASYLVPLDEQAQRTFGGLLRWLWPWSIGDSSPFGVMTATTLPLPGLFLAMASGTLLVLAVLSVFRVWVPYSAWWLLAVTGAAGSLCLMLLFFGATKILPIATALLIVAAGFDYWSPIARR